MKFFEKRQLEKEILSLDSQLTESTKLLKEAEDNFRKVKCDLDGEKQVSTNNLEKFNKANKLIREQTAADLLVNALTALGVIPAPKKTPDHFAEDNRLNQQMAAAQQQNYSNSQAGGGNLLGGLGLGGIY